MTETTTTATSAVPAAVVGAVDALRAALVAGAAAPDALDLRPWSVGAPGAATASPASTTPPASPALVAVRVGPADITVAATPGAPGPCPACLDLRGLHTLPEQERDAIESPRPVVLTTGALLDAATLVVVDALVRAATDASAQPDPWTPVWSLSRTTGEVRRHRLLRSSDCPVCHDPDDGATPAGRVRIESVPVEPGASRAVAPEDLRLPVDALANPVCGALGGPAMRAYEATATAPTTGRFTVRSKYGLHDMWWSGHADSYARSELLGALEGLERSAGQYNRAAPALWARADELDEPYVSPEDCGTYTAEFYERHRGQYVRWDARPSVPWVRGWNLTTDSPVLVPEQLVYYLDRRPDEQRSVQECSNGCASGSSLTEAVLHGLLELLERDAFLLSWYTGEPLVGIDLDTVRSPLVGHMRGRVDLLGYDLRCFDIRMDLPVPAVGALAVRRDGGLGTLCFAGGAGLDPEDAVQAAVCEVASYVPGFADRVGANLDAVRAMAQDPHRVTRLEHHALLFGLPEMARHAARWTAPEPALPLDEVFADWGGRHEPATDLAVAVGRLVRLLAERGLQTVVVDQTTPEQRSLGIRTASVVVPGLVPIDFGWERQRVLTMRRTLEARRPGDGRTVPRDPAALLRVPHPFP